jgi:hypothetical protein
VALLFWNRLCQYQKLLILELLLVAAAHEMLSVIQVLVLQFILSVADLVEVCQVVVAVVAVADTGF